MGYPVILMKYIYIYCLGISIVFVVPRKAPPSMLAFLEPFKNDLWLMIIVGKDITKNVKIKFYIVLFIQFLFFENRF